MRRRDLVYAGELILAVERNGGVLDDTAKLEAAQVTDRNIAVAKDPKRALQLAQRKFNVVMRRPDVRDAIRCAYKDLADFPVMEALSLHVDHIRGNIEREVVTKVMIYDATTGKPSHQETVVDTIKVPPSFAALQSYLKRTMPEPPREIHSRNENLTLRVNARVTDAPPAPTVPRQVGPAIPDVRDAFADAGGETIDSEADDEGDGEEDEPDEEERDAD